MRGLKNKESGQWKRWVSFLFLLSLLLLLANSLRGVYQKKKSAEEVLVRMEKEAQELKDREQFLKTSIQKIATKEGLEFEMRKKLNVAQVGERVAIIVDEAPASTSPDAPVSTWQKFKNFMLMWFK